MQKLFSEKLNDWIEVVRSWQTTHETVYLHKDGTYGYKDKTPVSDPAVFGRLMNPASTAYKAAMRWWDTVGSKLAKGEETPQFSYDEVFYFRYPIGEKPETLPPAQHWASFFTLIPDWWGKAEIIGIDGFMYEKEKTEPVPEKPVRRAAGL